MDRRPMPASPPNSSAPMSQPLPVEAEWEAQILDLVRSCLSTDRTGMSIAEVWRRLDIDNNNTMTSYEFNRMVLAYRPDLTQQHLDQLFYKVNISRSGFIS